MMLLHPNRAVSSGCWNCLHEVVVRSRLRPDHRAARLDLRVAGSHHIYGKSGSTVRLSVPIHGNRPLKTALLRHLVKLAEISDEDL